MTAAATTRVPPSRVLLVASFGALLAFLDATIVNVAFPSIRASFADTRSARCRGSSTPTTSSSPPSLIPAGGSPTSSAAGGRSSPASPCSPSPRRCAGLRRRSSCSSRPASSRRSAPRCSCRPRGPGDRAFPPDGAPTPSAWAASAAVAAGVGPPIGGALVELGGWRWAFLVNLPVRPGRGVGGRPSSSRAGRRAGARCPTSSARPCRRSASPRSTSASSRVATGAGQPAGARLLRRRRARAGAVRGELTAPPVADARPDPAAPAVVRPVLLNGGRGFRFLRLPAEQRAVPAVRLGLLRARAGLALSPGAFVAALVAAPRLGPWPNARLPRLRGPGGARGGRRLPLVPPARRPPAGLLGEWMPGGPPRHRRGPDVPTARRRRRSPRPRRRFATATAVVSSARQLGAACWASRSSSSSSATPQPAEAAAAFDRDGWLFSTTRACWSSRWARWPLGRLQLRPRGRGVADDTGRPVVLPPNPPADRRRSRRPGPTDEPPTCPTCPCWRRCPTRRAAASRRRPGSSTVPAGDLADPRGRPARLGVRRARRPARGARRRHGWCASSAPATCWASCALLTGEQRSADGPRPPRLDASLEIPRDGLRGRCSPPTRRPHGSCSTQVAERLRTAGGGGAAPSPPDAAVGGRRRRPRRGGVGRCEVAAVGEVLGRRLREHLRRRDARGDRPRRPGSAPSATTTGCCSSRHRPRTARMPPGATSACARRMPWCSWRERRRRRPQTGPSARPGPAARPGAAGARRRRPTQRVAWVAATDAWQLTIVDGDLATGAAARGRPARRPVTRDSSWPAAAPARSPTSGVLRELEEAGPARRPGRPAAASARSSPACTRRASTAATLEEICYAEFVRRKPFSDWRLPSRSLAEGTPGARRDGARASASTPCIEGLPRQLSHGQRRPGQPHPAGAPARPPASTRPSPSARLPVLFAPIARRRRTAARRRRGARQPAGRPAHRA